MIVQTKIEPDNLAIWRSVEHTDPRHTKRVNQRGGFTAISAHYQVMRATEVFGPVGIGWGYVNGEPIWHETLVFVPVTLWHGERSNTFGPLYGGAEWKNNKGYLDSDAPKKAATDGLTKALSQLGFNADVFMGRFDDNKYVEQMEREFAAQDAANDAAGGQSEKGAQSAPGSNPSTGEPAPAKGWREPDSQYSTPSKLHAAVTRMERELMGCGDTEMIYGLTATDDWKEFVRIAEIHAPHYLRGGDPAPPEFKGLLNIAESMVAEFDTATANHVADLARA